MAELKRNCPSEAYVDCPKCPKRGKSRSIKVHVTVVHGCEVDYHCLLPTADGSICNWSCGMKIGCFNTHQRVIHGVDFSDGAKHIYTAATGFAMRDSIIVGAKGHTAICTAGSDAQSKLVMKAGRSRHRLHRGEGAMEVVDMQTAAKVQIGARWYMQGGLREIVLRQDGVFVCELAEKLKRKRKPNTESPVKKLRGHEKIIHTVSASAPNTIIYEGEVPVIIGNMADVQLPIIVEAEDMHAAVSDGEDILLVDDEEDTLIVENAEDIITADIAVEVPTVENTEESIHAEVVNDSIDTIDLEDTDFEDDSGDEFVDYDYDVVPDEEEDESEVSIIEVETDEEEEVSAGDNEEDSEDEIDLQEAFMAHGGLDDFEDIGEEEIQVVDQAGPDVEEQGRGTDDTDFLFERLVEAVNKGERSLEWLMTNIGDEVAHSVAPGIGKKIALVMMTELTQIPEEEHAFIIMKWKMEQLAKQRKAWKK